MIYKHLTLYLRGLPQITTKLYVKILFQTESRFESPHLIRSLYHGSYFPFGFSSLKNRALFVDTTSTIMKHASRTVYSTNSSYKKQTFENSESIARRETEKKDDKSPRIYLIDEKEKVNVMTLMQAGKWAKRRDLKLVKVEDPGVKIKEKAVYKLITGKQYFEEEIRAKKSAKASPSKMEKVLVLNSTIAPNDLKAKLGSVSRWLKKGYQIKTTITSKGKNDDAQEVLSMVEDEVKGLEGRILQLREKGNDLKFYIAPEKVDK